MAATLDATMASELEKHDKLKEKYQQLKQSYAVLKKGLIDKQEGLTDKQEECSRLEQQLKEKETRLRQQIEEIDKLQYQNGRMSKQLGTLNTQVEELKQRSQQSGWSVGGLISGKPQQEAIQKAEEENRVLRDHMELKIVENEELHMKLFEEQRAHEEELQRLKDAEAATAAELQRQSADLDKERQQNVRLRGEVEEASEKIRLLSEQVAKANESLTALQDTLESERHDWKRQVSFLQAKLTRWVPFDDGEHKAWNLWNAAPQNGREVQQRSQSLQRLQACVMEACNQACGVLQLWGRALGGAGDEEPEPAPRAQVRTKLADAVRNLIAAAREVVPEMVSFFSAAQLRPSVAGVRELRKSTTALLQAHRKWVTYQSLLLMHDWSAAVPAAGRPGHEEARSIVGALWRLHRSTRTLLSRLRLLAWLPMLAARGSSTSHFALARKVLRQGGAAVAGVEVDDAAAAAERLHTSPERVLELAGAALLDTLEAWKGLGSCLSAWAAAQASASDSSQDGSALGELVESLQSFCAHAAEHVAPALEKASASAAVAVRCSCSSGRGSAAPEAGLLATACSPIAKGSSTSGGATSSGMSGYLSRAAVRLRQAPGGIGFEESLQTLLLARRLSAESTRAKGELRQQVKRLQVATEEKSALADELQTLQDKHELLRSNFQVLQDAAARRGEDEQQQRSPLATGNNNSPSSPVAASGLAQDRPQPGAYGDLVLSSRQRALLESLSVTAQESASLRQHGFFVDVISLSAGEAAQAAGPPETEASESWEVAVRKVYEQHCRGLQSQVRAADGRTIELQLSVQRCADQRREQEEVKQKLRDEVKAKNAQIDRVNEDMATTRKNYDAQLAMLTEHICTLSVKLSEKDAGLASLQAQKILCGHCGMWNNMGKLLSKEGGGTCKTCKEKLLSEGSA